MIKKLLFISIVAIIASALILVGCGEPAEEPTQQPTQQPTQEPTQEPTTSPDEPQYGGMLKIISGVLFLMEYFSY